MKVFIKVDLFGEESLTPYEQVHFEKLMDLEIDENNPAGLTQTDELILK